MSDATIKEFWKSYSKLDDYFDRREKLRELPFIKDLPELLKIEKMNDTDYVMLLTYVITSSFQTYVDDILDNIKEE